LILLEEPHAWVAAASLARLAGDSVETLIAPVPGVAFLSARGREAADLNEWWMRMATAPGRPVVVAAHEEDLPRWIPGLDADFVVAVPEERALAAYAHLPNVRTTVDDDPRKLAELVLGAPMATPVSPAPATLAGPPRPTLGDWPPVTPRPPRESPRPQPALDHEPRSDSAAPAPPETRFADAERQPGTLDPFELIARAQPIEQPSGPRNGGAPRSQVPPRWPASPSRLAPAGLSPRNILDRLGQGRRAPVSAELGQAVLACKPVLAAVVSRKGGVGKTASAAAVAAILGEAVDPFGHTAALVDANVGNPDAWGRLDLRGPTTTIREVVRNLMAGVEPPGPAYAETPALAVYPEARDAVDGYAPAQIHRVAGYLRARHAAVVVDLPNRLPAFTSADAAVAAAWIGEADVLVIPTTADPTALLGAIEYLDADSVQGKPVVVSYIVPRVRQIREAPQVRNLMERIRASVAAVVEVPDDDRATLALIKRIPITEVASELRQAYVNLATRVVEAAAQRHGTWP
jgi:MinD-like ATPase involved in chromosome partitioning or flagellar assembly